MKKSNAITLVLVTALTACGSSKERVETKYDTIVDPTNHEAVIIQSTYYVNATGGRQGIYYGPVLTELETSVHIARAGFGSIGAVEVGS